MARKPEIWRVASAAVVACLAAAIIPLALSALTAPLNSWALSPIPARWLATVTSPPTLILSLLLIAALRAVPASRCSAPGRPSSRAAPTRLCPRSRASWSTWSTAAANCTCRWA